MGVFGAVAPVITLGSISKRWLVPGWRLGWIATSDPSGVFQRTKVLDLLLLLLHSKCSHEMMFLVFQVASSIKTYHYICSDPTTFVQVTAMLQPCVQCTHTLPCLSS